MIKLSGLTSADKIIVVFSIIVITALFILTWSDSSNTRYASVSVNGENRYLIDLLEDKILEVAGERGYSKLEIKQGKVRFIESPCETHYCIRSGWLNPIVGITACLPNGISLQFINRDKTYDGINF